MVEQNQPEHDVLTLCGDVTNNIYVNVIYVFCICSTVFPSKEKDQNSNTKYRSNFMEDNK